MTKIASLTIAVVAASLALISCAPSAGAACGSDDECLEEQECLTNFKGGYCGIKDCEGDDDCPSDTQCVSHEGSNYCFLRCVDKAECNAERPADAEANCSSNIERVGDSSDKACVPPAG